MDCSSSDWMSHAVGVSGAVDFGPVDVGEGFAWCAEDGIKDLIGDLSDEVAVGGVTCGLKLTVHLRCCRSCKALFDHQGKRAEVAERDHRCEQQLKRAEADLVERLAGAGEAPRKRLNAFAEARDVNVPTQVPVSSGPSAGGEGHQVRARRCGKGRADRTGGLSADIRSIGERVDKVHSETIDEENDYVVGLFDDIIQRLRRRAGGVVEGLGLEDAEGFSDGETERGVIWLVVFGNDAVELVV